MKPLTLSYSSSDTYESCGYKYYLRYKEFIVPFIPIRYPLVTGVAFHDLVNKAYLSENFDRKEMIKNWKSCFMEALEQESRAFSDTSDYEKYLKYGYGLISRFHKFAEKEGYLIKPLHTEWGFKIKHPDFPNDENGEPLYIVGKVDLIIKREQHPKLELLDFKTGWKEPKEEFVHQSKQLTLYDWAAKTELGLENTEVGLFYPRQGRVFVSNRNIDQHRDSLNNLAKIASNIKQGIFEPNLDHCKDCELQKYCKFYKKESHKST